MNRSSGSVYGYAMMGREQRRFTGNRARTTHIGRRRPDMPEERMEVSKSLYPALFMTVGGETVMTSRKMGMRSPERPRHIDLSRSRDLMYQFQRYKADWKQCLEVTRGWPGRQAKLARAAALDYIAVGGLLPSHARLVVAASR